MGEAIGILKDFDYIDEKELENELAKDLRSTSAGEHAEQMAKLLFQYKKAVAQAARTFCVEAEQAGISPVKILEAMSQINGVKNNL